MRNSSIIIVCIFFLAILFNISQFFSSKNNIRPKDNSLVFLLNKKNIIFPEIGERAKKFFLGASERCFWNFVGVAELQTQNFSYYPEFISLIPKNAKKACFSSYNICAFWFDNEVFTNFYFIDPFGKTEFVFDTTTVLVSPQLLSYLTRIAK